MRYVEKWMGMGHPYSLASLVNFFLTLAETLLLVRVVVHFFFTTAGGSFFSWVNYTTDPLLSPFRGVFTNPTAVPGNWYVDYPALFAMAVYGAFGALLLGLVAWRFGVKGNR